LSAGEYVQVSIADQGTGIAQDVLPKIFDPYFSTKQRGAQKGMGLGLTICHSIVQKHQGAITVESTVGVGTTFHIYLPANRNLHDAGKPLAPADSP
jgi:signal transduction histidine kinase